MPRLPRVVVPNCPHHITQRGNNRQDVFFCDQDREIYLRLLRKYAAEYRVDIVGYCLMTNHVHIVATPATDDGLSNAIGLTHNDYSRWLHVRRSESGHLWQCRFYSCPVEQRYLSTVMAYVERNPVRAGLVGRPDDWPWSSARAHLTMESKGTTDWLHLSDWARNWTPGLWRVFLEDGNAEAEVQSRLLEATRTGRPLGDEPFIENLEERLGIPLHKQKTGPKATPRIQQKTA